MSTALAKPKKLKLTDYEVFQTLGTGINVGLGYLRFVWKSETGKK